MKAHVWFSAIWLASACNHDSAATFGEVPPEVSAPGPNASGGGGGGGAGGSAGGEVTSAGSGGGPTAAGGPSGGAQGGGSTSVAGAEGGKATAEAGASGAAPEEVGGSGGGAGPAAPLPEPPEPPNPTCGNGVLDPGEECDGSGPCKECQVDCSLLGQGAVESKNHHCYRRSQDRAAYDGAKASCAAQGGYLATIADKEENDLVRTALAGSSFIGASEDVALMSGAAGTYAWVTGEPFSFTNWARGEPNRDRGYCSNGGGLNCFEHCLAMISAGTWEDHRCDLVDGYVCEWEPKGQAR